MKGTYRIFFKKSAIKELKKIPAPDIKRIVGSIKTLADSPRPHGCEKLTEQERYRIRQGNYRIIYSIQDRELVIWVVKVGHRKDVYEKNR